MQIINDDCRTMPFIIVNAKTMDRNNGHGQLYYKYVTLYETLLCLKSGNIPKTEGDQTYLNFVSIIIIIVNTHCQP